MLNSGGFFYWLPMRYEKPALTFEEQADLLITRGLIVDRTLLINQLRSVSYYRLRGYTAPFQDENDRFRAGTTFDEIWRRYTFDRRLRLLVMDPIERIEVAVRTALAYELAHSSGPFGYTEPAHLPNLTGDRLGQFLSRLYELTQQSQEPFVLHFRRKYSDHHGYLPIWMAAEIIPFGTTLTLLRGVRKGVRARIATRFGVADDVLFSWMKSLNTVRNICAHHGRLWNRVLGMKPKIPRGRKHREWHDPTSVPNDRIYAVLTVCKYSLDLIAPQSQWPQRLESLLEEYAEIPLHHLGFVAGWKNSAIWKQY